MSTLESSCAPPLRMFIIGTGSRCAFGPPRYRKRLSPVESAAARATARETPRIAFAPSSDLSGVPSRSSIFWSIAGWSVASKPTISGKIRSAMLSTAFSTPLPWYRSRSPSRSSTASKAPVDAPDGTAARAIVPSSSPISTSTVGLPRESRISRATIASMVATGTPCRRRDDGAEPIGSRELPWKGVTTWKRDCAASRYRARLGFMRAAARVGQTADGGVIPPQLVIGLLTAAAVDTQAVVTTRDTTIAGENATCVQVSGVQNAKASSFEVCVTTGGLLGSFTGLVSGTQIDVRLDRFDPTVAPDAFDLPPGARIVDKRPK